MAGTLTATIQSYAGNGLTLSNYAGDNGAATDAELNYPSGVAVDEAGNLYIADLGNNRIREVNAKGIIRTVAGDGVRGYTGDNGAATDAELNHPSRVAVDGAGNLYIADSGNNRIREVNTRGIITTVAGNGAQGYAGDNGTATDAELNYPSGVAVDGAGNLYIADSGNNRIREVNTKGIIRTVAGDGVRGYAGDNGVATDAEVNYPGGVALDKEGNLYIADSGNNRVRKVNTSGIITTVAGDGVQGYAGDGNNANISELNHPSGVAVDGAGNLYIADSGNDRIREVNPSGVMTTIVGDGVQGYTGDGGPAVSAEINYPTDVAPDGVGNLYLADCNNLRVRFVDPPPPVVIGLTPVSGSETGGTVVNVNGGGFAHATAVEFGNTPGTSLTVNSATSLTVIAPPGKGTVDVTVTGPGGASTTGAHFGYVVPPPVVIGLTPTTGAETGGTMVTITGRGFTHATAVKFGNTLGTSLMVNSDTSLTVISPPGKGTVDVTVTGPGGTATTHFRYVVPAPPIGESVASTGRMEVNGDPPDNNDLPPGLQKIEVLATGYSAHDQGENGRGITYTGTIAKQGECAVDPSVIPFGTVLYVPGYGLARAEDTGSAIKGKHIDLFFSSTQEAMDWGCQYLSVTIMPK